MGQGGNEGIEDEGMGGESWIRRMGSERKGTREGEVFKQGRGWEKQGKG